MSSSNSLYEFDEKLRQTYGSIICGVDEVGRGSWSGPILSAAVILPPTAKLPGVNDSKKITHKKREEMYDRIMEVALSYDIAMVEASLIDQRGLTWANRKVMRDAAQGASNKLQEPVGLYVVDQAPSFSLQPHIMLPKADGTSLSVAAASIIAKVTRDRLMIELDKTMPEYGFADHKGYINEDHKAAVLKYGLVKGIHRFSYQVNGVNAPVQFTLEDFL